MTAQRRPSHPTHNGTSAHASCAYVTRGLALLLWTRGDHGKAGPLLVERLKMDLLLVNVLCAHTSTQRSAGPIHCCPHVSGGETQLRESCSKSHTKWLHTLHSPCKWPPLAPPEFCNIHRPSLSPPDAGAGRACFKRRRGAGRFASSARRGGGDRRKR